MDFTRRTSLDNSALCRRNTPPVLSTAQQQQVQQAKQQAQAQATQQVQEQLAQGQISWCGEASSPGTLGTAVAGGSVLARMGNGLKASTPFPEPIPEHSGAALSHTTSFDSYGPCHEWATCLRLYPGRLLLPALLPACGMHWLGAVSTCPRCCCCY